MRLISTSSLALAVSRAGAIGFLGLGTDSTPLAQFLKSITNELLALPVPNTPEGILPIGIGFICWGADLKVALDAIQDATLKPAAAWLFAPQDINELVAWADGIRKASAGKTHIWVQVGTVEDATKVARLCRPEALVIQGSDAGGHGLKRSASIISLLPECADALRMEGFENIPLIGAGGIADSRGVVAALALGASGVSMGTRFLASPEAEISNGYREDVIRATDGGITTTRTSVYDQLRGTTGWPESYNARGVLNGSFFDWEKGMEDEENEKLYQEAMTMGDKGWGKEGRMTTYAGTGIGLVKSVMPAGEIVKEVLSGVRQALAGGK
jgi:nitronate monooxygenase